MKTVGYPKEAVLVIGRQQPTFSIVVCLLAAEYPVTLCTDDKVKAQEVIHTHWNELSALRPNEIPRQPSIHIISQLHTPRQEKLVIAITPEDVSEKKEGIRKIEQYLPADAIIAINTKSVPLHILQENTTHQQRIIGANWVEPAHTTFFLEIITNEHTAGVCSEKFCTLATKHWNKDPYVLTSGLSIRTRMMCAMIREAFYLIKKGYVTPQDVDRACRNDPGYYFPFAGNFRYMDLMGGYLYGVVMKDLNPDLAKDREIPDFFNEIMEKEQYGMESGRGFYEYEEGEAENWHTLFRKFSYQIRDIIDKYPFNYLEKEIPAKTK